MGPASHKGIPTRTGSNTMATEAHASNKLLYRAKGNDLQRDQRIIGQGCNGRDHPFPGRLCVTDLPGSKEGGWTEASDKPEGTQNVCETQTFQNGRTTYPSQPHPTRGLDDKVGSEGCLPSDTNPGRAPTPPSVPMGTQNLPVSVPLIRVDISPTGFLQSNETGDGSTPTYGYSSSHIPGRYSTATPVKRGAGSADSTDLPAVQGSGAGRESEEVDTDSRPETGVFGFSGRHSQTTANLPTQEAEENKTASSTPPSPTDCYSEGHSEVCWEGLSINTSCMASSPSL